MILELTLLYDFYENLLTDKQREAFEMYYFKDYSLQEIGDIFNTSRQSVQDIIKRTKDNLFLYEEKLSLVDKYNKTKEVVTNIEKQINSSNIENKDNINTMLSSILEI